MQPRLLCAAVLLCAALSAAAQDSEELPSCSLFDGTITQGGLLFVTVQQNCAVAAGNSAEGEKPPSFNRLLLTPSVERVSMDLGWQSNKVAMPGACLRVVFVLRACVNARGCPLTHRSAKARLFSLGCGFTQRRRAQPLTQ